MVAWPHAFRQNIMVVGACSKEASSLDGGQEAEKRDKDQEAGKTFKVIPPPQSCTSSSRPHILKFLVPPKKVPSTGNQTSNT
jgi:hypothetical protein